MEEPNVKVFKDRTEWYNLEGQLHREDGPAVIWTNGSKQWYLNGNELTEEEFLKRAQADEPSIEQIAKKFGVSLDKLKIKK